MIILEIKILSVEFLNTGTQIHETFRAVDKVNLVVREGVITSLVGESGSGKSVTALSICGLLKPYRRDGEIYFYPREGPRINLLSASEKEILNIRGKEISYIFQDPASSLNPVMRVGDQVREAYLAHFESSSGMGEKRAKEMLEAAKIKDVNRVYHSFPHELSGGMKQRAMIAMALISGPRLLIADEPTTALDVMTEAEIMELLGTIQKERRLAVLFITHNLSLAAAFSKSIYVMEKGRVAEHLERGESGFSPAQAYTKKLFSAHFHHTTPKSLIGV